MESAAATFPPIAILAQVVPNISGRSFGHVRVGRVSLCACNPVGMARTQSKTYRRRQQDIAAFAEALSRFLDVCEAHESFAGNPTWAPRPGQEAEAGRRAAELDVIAGRAASAFGSEYVINWSPRGTFQEYPVNPATGWATILDRDPNFTVDVIFSVCRQAVGSLDARAIEAEEHEQSLAGKVERITGSNRRSLSRNASGGIRGAFVAFIVGVPATLVGAYLAFRFGWV
jgi:hypothetical protein